MKWTIYSNKIKIANLSSFAINKNDLTSLDIRTLDTSQCQTFNRMLYGCRGLTSLNLSGINTTNGTDFGYMFYGCSSLTSLDLSNFNTANGTNFSSMFESCTKLTSLDVRNFNTANCTDFSNMFAACPSLRSLDVSNFDTSKATNLSGMFRDCYSLGGLNISNFDTSQCTDFSYMFAIPNDDMVSPPRDWTPELCLKTIDLSHFDVSKGENFYGMFMESFFTTLDLSNFTPPNTACTEWMFMGCTSLTSLDLSNFPNTRDTSNMFDWCDSLHTIKLGSAFFNGNFNPFDFSDCPWGTGGPESLKSLKDSLIINTPITRASATIQLSDATKALLTADEKAAITAKGYTIA